MVPQEMLKSKVSELPFPPFSAGNFQLINMTENAAVSCLFYPSQARVILKAELSLQLKKNGKKG